MKRRFLLLSGVCGAGSAWAQIPKLDDLMKEAGKLGKAPTAGTVGAGDDMAAFVADAWKQLNLEHRGS